MERPKIIAKTKTGIQPSICGKLMSPKVPAAPHSKKMTSKPYAAPIESRFKVIAFSGRSTERNARRSRM